MSIMNWIRNSRYFKMLAVFLGLNLLLDGLAPVVALALTSGPSQPEVQSFEPMGTTEMVDLFSGDFTYNIPLFDVGGYPVNLAYHSGITMDQEASWVGLGWNINPGSLTRNLRGLPDDFNGDTIKSTTHRLPSNNYAISGTLSKEFFGLKTEHYFKEEKILNLSLSLGINYNNYKGFGIDMSFSPTLSFAKLTKMGPTAGLDFGLSSQSGADISARIGINPDNGIPGVGLSTSLNSRAGLKQMTMDLSANYSKDKNIKLDHKASIQFTAPMYFPTQEVSMNSWNFSLDANFGIEFWGLQPNLRLLGAISKQSILHETESVPAYGYLNEQYANNQSKALLDFNREKDGTVSIEVPNLPVPVHTYDIFNYTAQGAGGTFRAYRSDIGILGDSKTKSNSTSGKGGVELATLNTIKLGVNLGLVNTSGYNGRWRNTSVNSLLEFKNNKDIEKAYAPLYEPYYFKNMGEMTIMPPTFYDQFKEHDPVRLRLVNFEAFANIEPVLENDNNWESRIKNSYLEERVKRNEVIYALENAERLKIGINKNVQGYNYQSEDSGVQQGDFIQSGIRVSHHIGEMTILQPGGWRYTYGIPAYNILHKEVSFNIGNAASPDCSTGLVAYATTDNSTSNDKGIDHYYHARELPSYAHSYLLTNVLSPEYVDVEDDGPTTDDLGNFVSFKYFRSTDSYKWRTPHGGNTTRIANFDEGMKSKDKDDKANYIYGEKENWYLQRIETKTHIAEFYLSPRNDGRGVVDENGDIDETSGNSLYKLDSIKLYARVDLERYGQTGATPIKTVYLEYDYSLCQGIENYYDSGSQQPYNGGKLTLKKLYFKYGKSHKGRINSYRFTYADYNHDGTTDSPYNPDYNMRSYDRWGSYKPNPSGSSCSPVSGPLHNTDNPYTPQDTIFSGSSYFDAGHPERTYADAYAVVWNLTSIDLPSGGSINIDYESDDYAYVQDKRAMQMVPIKWLGSSSGTPSDTSNLLYKGTENQNNYLFVKMRGKLNTESVENLVGDIKGKKDGLYFKAFTKTKPGNVSADDEYEYVPGYCTILDYGISYVTNDSTMIWLQMEPESVRDRGSDKTKKYNPITLAGLNMMRVYLNEKLHPGSDPKGEDETALKGLIAASQDLFTFFKNENVKLMNRKYCKSIILKKSFIRLYTPANSKKGGGSRVKKITTNDNWNKMVGKSTTGYEASEYGQIYEYGDNFGSFGVASYEPIIGGEENPFREPIRFTNKTPMVPDPRFIFEKPIGESYYPSASVGYCKVIVKNLDYEDVARNVTGYSVHEFYTAKDFPTKVSETKIDRETSHGKSGPVIKSFLLGITNQYHYASQGYAIELNDMHGKPKSQVTYGGFGENNRISGVRYEYLTEGNVLLNEVDVCTPDGQIKSSRIGVEVEPISDLRMSSNTTTDIKLEFQMDGFFVGIIPIVVPTAFIHPATVYDEFRSAVFQKVIYRYGILHKTTAYDFGSTIETTNELWDAETGQVLLTKTHNEYDDPVYNLSYPAHWAYDGMGSAYKNIGMNFKDLTVTNGYVNLPLQTGAKASDYFAKGDELMVSTPAMINNYKLWVLEVDDTNEKIYVVDRLGNPASSLVNVSLKVIRSGRRNLQTTPIGSITALSDPMDNGWDTMNNVINSTASEFSDAWQMLCAEGVYPNCEQNCSSTGFYSDLESTLHDMASTIVETPTGYSTVMVGDSIYGYNLSFHSIDHTDSLKSYNPDKDMVGSYNWYLHSSNTNTLVGSIGKSYNSGCTITLTLPTTITPASLGFSSYSQFWQCVKSFSNLTVDAAPYPCFEGSIYTFTVDIAAGGSGSAGGCESITAVGPLTLIGSTSCYPLTKCTSNPMNGLCYSSLNEIGNPFLLGIRGNWYPKNQYQFNSNRTPTSGTGTDIRADGMIINFEPFWELNTGVWEKSTNTMWVSSATVTKMLPFGFDVENVDPLGNYSSAIYGYNYTLPKAIAKNARYNDIAFDGFEDYNYPATPCRPGHFDFQDVTPAPVLSTAYRHSGKKSLKLSPGDSIYTGRDFDMGDCESENDTIPYYVHCQDCAGYFGPTVDASAGRKFILSYWMREETGDTIPVFDYNDGGIFLRIGTTLLNTGSKTKSKIIEGWQQIEQEFTIPSSATGALTIVLKNNSDIVDTYFDDIRIHPFDALVVSYAYDPVSQKLIAQLDENNFATFYEYDKEGNLVRIKKETERGIVTIQESRQNFSIDK